MAKPFRFDKEKKPKAEKKSVLRSEHFLSREQVTFIFGNVRRLKGDTSRVYAEECLVDGVARRYLETGADPKAPFFGDRCVFDNKVAVAEDPDDHGISFCEKCAKALGKYVKEA